MFDLQYLSIENPEDIQYSTKLLVNNSCFFREYMVGKDSPDLRAKVKIIGAAIQQPFYTEMRTNQQLGYIVWSYSSAKDETHFLSFLIQSGVYPADELDKRAGEFLLSSTNILKEMDDEMFQKANYTFPAFDIVSNNLSSFDCRWRSSSFYEFQ